MRRRIPIYLAALLLGGCCTPWNGPAIVLTPSGAPLCAKHRVPLVSMRGFAEERDVKADPAPEYFRIAACFPNGMGIHVSRQQIGPGWTPTTITYCPECEKHFKRYKGE